MADLLDADQVAKVLGISGGPKAVSVYRAKYDTFPEPLRVGENGRCALWYRPHVEAWLATHTTRPRRRPDEDVAPPPVT